MWYQFKTKTYDFKLSVAMQQIIWQNPSCRWRASSSCAARRFVSSTLLLWWIQRNLRVALFFCPNKGLTLSLQAPKIIGFSHAAAQ